MTFPSKLTFNTTPTNASLKLPPHVNGQDSDQESLTAQELSMLRRVLGTASWRAQQVSPQFAVDVSLWLSSTADPVVQDLLDADKLVLDVRRSSAQSLHFYSFFKE